MSRPLKGYSRGSLPAAFRRQDAILSLTDKLSSALSQRWTYTLCMLCILNVYRKSYILVSFLPIVNL
jgi:hypothetical protein